MRCHWLKIITKLVPIQSQALFSVAVSGLTDGMNYFCIISKSCSAALNYDIKKLSTFHFYFFSKTRKNVRGRDCKPKDKKLWPKLSCLFTNLI